MRPSLALVIRAAKGNITTKVEERTFLRILLPREHGRLLDIVEAIPDGRERLDRCLGMVTSLADGDATDSPYSTAHSLRRRFCLGPADVIAVGVGLSVS